jgi:hypothetical protein
LVTIVAVQGDSFDLGATITYTDGEGRVTMVAEDFRRFFRRPSSASAHDVCPLPSVALEEWESSEGRVYLVLDVDQRRGVVHVVAAEGSSRSFLVRSIDFARSFRPLVRRTDFARLLDEG